MINVNCDAITIKINNSTITKNLSLEFKQGECWGILGANGIGKTTLLHALAGLKKIAHGNIYLNNNNINQLSRKTIAKQLGLLLQNHNNAFDSEVFDYILRGRYPHRNLWQAQVTNDEITLADIILKQLELTDLKNRLLSQLSGGEQRRVNLARLIIQEPDIFLLDEPLNHLDLHHQLKILDYLAAIKSKKLVIMAMHDVNLVQRYCNKVLMLLNNGEYLAGNVSDLFNTENFEKLYNHKLFSVKANNHCYWIPN